MHILLICLNIFGKIKLEIKVIDVVKKVQTSTSQLTSKSANRHQKSWLPPALVSMTGGRGRGSRGANSSNSTSIAAWNKNPLRRTERAYL